MKFLRAKRIIFWLEFLEIHEPCFVHLWFVFLSKRKVPDSFFRRFEFVGIGMRVCVCRVVCRLVRGISVIRTGIASSTPAMPEIKPNQRVSKALYLLTLLARVYFCLRNNDLDFAQDESARNGF